MNTFRCSRPFRNRVPRRNRMSNTPDRCGKSIRISADARDDAVRAVPLRKSAEPVRAVPLRKPVGAVRAVPLRRSVGAARAVPLRRSVGATRAVPLRRSVGAVRAVHLRKSAETVRPMKQRTVPAPCVPPLPHQNGSHEAAEPRPYSRKTATRRYCDLRPSEFRSYPY